MGPAASDISSQFLLTLGIILLVGLMFTSIAQRSILPRATLLLIFGAVIGESLLDLIPELFTQHFELIADITLLMVGFLLGGKLTASSLRDHSIKSFAISCSAAVIPASAVFLGMVAMGVAIESLFMVVFFVLAGASQEFGALALIGSIGVVYILCRAAGKYLGAWLGASLSRAGPSNRHWMGTALLPQAGVAIGMALVASNRFPEHRQIMLPIVIASTVVFEIIGRYLPASRFGTQPTPGLDRSYSDCIVSSNSSSPACRVASRTAARSPSKRYSLATRCWAEATAIQTVPTGLSALPPPGPATPVTASA